MLWVVDADAARQALSHGLLRCPQPGCAGRLRSWSKARPRSIRLASGDNLELTPDRALCGTCRVTHVLLPAFYVPRRAYCVDVIGSVLLAKLDGVSHRGIAAATGVPRPTVRRWLRGVQRGASWLVAQATTLAGTFGATVFGPSPASWAGSPLAEAVGSLGVAAERFANDPGPTLRPGPLTGVDYLGTLAKHHRRRVEDELHMVDPEQRIAELAPWQQVNLITSGRLLNSTPSG